MRPSVGAEFEPQRVRLRSADPAVREHGGGWFAAERYGQSAAAKDFEGSCIWCRIGICIYLCRYRCIDRCSEVRSVRCSAACSAEPSSNKYSSPMRVTTSCGL